MIYILFNRKCACQCASLMIGGQFQVHSDDARKVERKSIGKKIIEKKQYTINSVLNDVLNETAASDEWKTMGGGKFDSSRMNELVGKQYGDMMNSNSNIAVTVDGQTADFLKKDYSAVVKKGLEIDKQKHRG